MKSVMSHSFAQIPQAEIQRSSFDRSHGYKTTLNAGLLYPFYVDEVYPGDSFNLKMTAFARMATLINVPMDNMFLETFFFFVPMRLVWTNWVKFCGEQANPTDSTDFTIPQIVAPASTGFQTGSIFDYMGIPVGVPNISISALPLRAYNLIYQNWFKDQNLIGSPIINNGDGPDNYADYDIRRRAKRPDYLTSCLPWPQKHADVTLAIAAEAPVVADGTLVYWRSAVDGTDRSMQENPDFSLQMGGPTLSATENVYFGSETGLKAQLPFATPIPINQFREAFQLQRLFERDARGGTRYPELIKSHFLVRDPQFDVLQRPQYLGGGSTPVNIHHVPQTSASGAYADTPQANLAGYATITASNHGFTKSFTEHGYVIGILNLRADINYQQGIERFWSRKTRFDFYYPALAHLGEMAVLNKEIYAQGNASDDEVFGYQEVWSDLRYKKSNITGKFRSNETGGTPLDSWHLAQDFANLPTLSQQFIEDNPPVERVIAVPSEPHFILDSYIKLICARPLPTYGVPGYVDHF